VFSCPRSLVVLLGKMGYERNGLITRLINFTLKFSTIAHRGEITM